MRRIRSDKEEQFVVPSAKGVGTGEVEANCSSVEGRTV